LIKLNHHEDQFWNDIDVPVSDVRKIAKGSFKKAVNYLKSYSALNKEFLGELADDFELDVEKIKVNSVIETIKDKHEELFFVLLALKHFSHNKSTEFIQKYAEKYYKIKSDLDVSNRLFLLYKLYKKDSTQFQRLYWSYKVWRRTFEKYKIDEPQGSFFEWMNTSVAKQEFEKKLSEFAKKKATTIRCWYVLEESDSNVFCIRGFPKAIINPGVNKNDEIDRADTLIVRVYKDNKIGIARGSITQAKKMFNYLLKQQNSKGSFTRIVNYFNQVAFFSFMKKIMKTEQSDGKLVSITFSRTQSVDKQPKLVVARNDRVVDSIADLKNKNIDLNLDLGWIESFDLIIGTVTVPIIVEKLDGQPEVALFCSKNRFSEESEAQIEAFCNRNSIQITYGRDQYAD